MENEDMNIGLIGFGSMGKTHAYAVENMRYFFRPDGVYAKITGVCTCLLYTSRSAEVPSHFRYLAFMNRKAR